MSAVDHVSRSGKPAVVAHRGASLEAPEHTARAYESALAQGADGLECDVRMTSDHQLVCIHDRTVDRTSDGTGIVSEMSLAQLRELDFGSWHADGKPAQILTLRELLTLTLDWRRPVRLFIETKHPVRYGSLVEQAILETLQEFGVATPPPADHSRAVVISFSAGVWRIRRNAPMLPTILLGETSRVLRGSAATAASAPPGSGRPSRPCACTPNSPTGPPRRAGSPTAGPSTSSPTSSCAQNSASGGLPRTLPPKYVNGWWASRRAARPGESARNASAKVEPRPRRASAAADHVRGAIGPSGWPPARRGRRRPGRTAAAVRRSGRRTTGWRCGRSSPPATADLTPGGRARRRPQYRARHRPARRRPRIVRETDGAPQAFVATQTDPEPADVTAPWPRRSPGPPRPRSVPTTRRSTIRRR